MNSYKLKTKTFSIAMEPAESYDPCTSPRAVGAIMRAIFEQLDLDQSNEHFVVVVLNAKGRVVGYKLLATGTETACLVSLAMVFRAALVLGGTSVIACHNHPSGDPTPSREDQVLTRRMRAAGDVLGLPLSDHIILGDTYYTFRASEAWDNN